MTRMMSSSDGGEHNEGIFTAPLVIQQDCTRAGTVHVGTSDENGEAFTGVNGNSYDKTRVLKY